MKTKSKSVIVNAIQWVPDSDFCYFENDKYFNKRIGYGKNGEEYLITEVGIRVYGGFIKLKPGDWIIKGIYSEISVCPKELIKEYYVL